MATFEAGLYSFLTVTASGVIALVGNKVYPLRAPDTLPSPPYITYQKITGRRDTTHDGNSGLANPQFQINCWSTTYLSAKTLALEVVKALNGYKGAMGGTARVASFVNNELDMFDPKTKLYSSIVEVIFWHSEDT